MIQKKITTNKDKANKIKEIYNKTFAKINKVKEERNEKINNILKEIDNKQIAEVLKDIKNIK